MEMPRLTVGNRRMWMNEPLDKASTASRHRLHMWRRPPRLLSGICYAQLPNESIWSTCSCSTWRMSDT